MKLFKKLAILCATLLTVAGLGMMTACKDDESTDSSQTSESITSESTDSSNEESGEIKNYTYRIKVQNETGYGFKDLTVRLMNGETEIAKQTTSKNGNADFAKSDALPLGKYTITIDKLPKGYALKYPDLTYETMPEDGFEVRIVLVPTGVIAEAAPAGTFYNVGDVMHDFSVLTSDGSTFTLSEVLKEKEMVMINFWATWCGPCKSEFPAMNNAYIEYQDRVAIIAISTTDDMAAVANFKQTNGLQFDMTSNSESGANVAGMFNTSGIPVSIMVDRYGVVGFYHMGSMTSNRDFTSRFDRFLGENYTPTVIVGSGETEDGSGEEVDLRLKPDIPNPDPADISEVLNGGDKFTFSWDTEDEYSWPWIIAQSEQDSAKKYIKPGILADGNYATLIAKVNAKGNNAFSFDYVLNTEADCDILYVLIDNVPVYQLSGTGNPVGTPKNGHCTYVFPAYETEVTEHTIHFLYLKDSSASMADECVQISNLQFLEDGTDEDALIFRHAANVANVDSEGKLLEGATSYYKHYANVVLNEQDGYYHVGTEDGPLLFANLMFSSRWSDTSVWLLAYSDCIVADGYNFHADIEAHAWAANQPVPGYAQTFGYAPVTEDLRELLEFAAMSDAVKREGLKFWTGAYHENEWLEMCAYWEHRGGTLALEDPMKTITFHAAQEVSEGENTAKVLFAMTPRGFKYKFTPKRSGVYNIYSNSKTIDSECFLVAPDQTTFLGNYTDVIGKTHPDGTPDENFNFHYYLEANQTYYLLMTTYLDQTCEYKFYIDYVGETYTYLENMSVGPYSFNEVSFELFLPDAKAYVYSDPAEGGDGYYYVQNKDGSLGGRIYVDMTRATAFFPNNSLYDTAIADDEKDDITKRNFYINGVDYTDILLDYGDRATTRADGIQRLNGFIELDKPLFDVLCAITRSARFEGIGDSWQMLCYYEKTLSAS